ncbi:MAG: phage holin family protein [Candidatus Andeanibacterium colombiense]|uniref:Phage holin family protein n=1 Tax=Candidatus Andeanibacterium colombiense TaxID=3121345 RepID=A0AAJ6BPF1_9SPHN|nr:MAG: phage holin family protein [Sphingomonadaceae bacterium]
MAADRSEESEPVLESDPETDGESPGSLFDDVGALIEDGRTYAEAELAFQKTRLAYILDHAKRAALFSGIALVLVVLAIVVLVVGILISLMQVMTPIAATMVTMFGLLLVAGLLGMFAQRAMRGIKRAFESESDG